MCGILGGNAFNNLEEMEKGLTSMMHRGTDGNTIFHFPENNFYLSYIHKFIPYFHTLHH